VLSFIGFWKVYGPERFVGAIVIGAVGPWVAARRLRSTWEAARRRAASSG